MFPSIPNFYQSPSKHSVIHSSNYIDQNKCKRSFLQYEEQISNLSSEINNYINSLNKVYHEYSIRNPNWYEEFKLYLKEINFIEMNEYVPYTSNRLGSCIFQKTEFWVLYINFVYDKLGLKLDIIRNIFDEGFEYASINFDSLMDFFYNFIKRFKKKDIYDCIKLNNQGYLLDLPNCFNDLTVDHYKYILNPKNSMQVEYKSILNSQGNKSRKVIDKEDIINKYLDNWIIPYSDEEIAKNISSFLPKKEIISGNIYDPNLNKVKIEDDIVNRISRLDFEIPKEKNVPMLNKLDSFSINNVDNFQITKKFNKHETATQTYLIETNPKNITVRKKENRFSSHLPEK